MNEKFGVELELVTKKFKEKMEVTKNKVAEFARKTKEDFQFGMYIDTSNTKKELTDLKKQYQETFSKKGLMDKTFTIDFDQKGDIVIPESELRDLQINLSSMTDKSVKELDSLQQKIKDVSSYLNSIETSKIAKLGSVFGKIKNNIEQAGNKIKTFKSESNGVGNSINKAFDKGLKSVKRFALSLVGIHSIWRGVSKASSAYLSQDVELSNKLSAVWVGLGSMLEPILSSLANWFVKLVGYLNVFIKAFTGVDLLANAMDKANKNTKATAKSTKTLNGQLAGFDEINNIDTSDDSKDGASADTSWVDTFSNVQLDTSWTEKITNFGIWMQNNWMYVVGLIAGTAGALKLVELGVGGIKSLGIGLILAGIVITISSIIEFIKDPTWDNFANILTGLAIILAGVAIAMLAVNAANPVAWIMLAISALVALVAVIIKNWDKIKETIKNCIDSIKNFFSGLWTSIKNIFSKVGSWFGEKFTSAWNAIKKAFSPVTSFFKGIWTTIKNMFTKIGTTIGDAIGGAFKTVVNTIIKFAENKINGFIKAINVAIGVINAIPRVEIKKLALLNIPKLATGTNYVPNDQLAYIHKGEAVVPRKFNSEEFFGRGNDETNSLIKELIEVIEEKDNNLYLDGKIIGKTAKDYISKQNRIMGRSYV